MALIAAELEASMWKRGLLVAGGLLFFLLALYMFYPEKKFATENVESLVLSARAGNEWGPDLNINEKTQVKAILGCINFSYREPAKFLSAYSIKINYPGGTKYALVNGKYVKIDGVSYRTFCDLEARLKSLSSNQVSPKTE